MTDGDLIPIRRLLDTQKSNPNKPDEQEDFYARSWGLQHYLTFSTDRRAQLATYLRVLREGKTTIQAAEEAFGDLDQLGSELNRYLQGKRFQQAVLTPQKVDVTVDIRPLSAGAVATMPTRMRSMEGTSVDQARNSCPTTGNRQHPIRTIRARRPISPKPSWTPTITTRRWLPPISALAADPANLDALVTKGWAVTQKAKADHVTDPKVWDGSRKWFAMANHADPDATIPLMGYYVSYLDQGVQPPQLAKLGLQKAQLLSPTPPASAGGSRPASWRIMTPPPRRICFVPTATSRPRSARRASHFRRSS